MDAYSRQLFEKHEVASLVNYVDDLDPEHFSLITFIDSLVPELVMESNLRFGSFHLVKMSLFIRNLSKRGVFSSETEIELAKLVIQHLYHLEWISVSADSLSHAADPVTDPLGEMLSEIADNNAHNAYFYASQAFFEDKQALFNLLLLNGAISIPHSLGHSISCFYPVLEDVIAVDHPAAGTSLLSLIMYLCRFGKETSAEADEKPLRDSDKGQLLRRAASGNDIVSIHHMITFYILQTWENASWNQDTIPPWSLLTDWIGEKRVDEKRVALAAKPEAAAVPDSYQDWQCIFSSRDPERIIDSAIAILNESWETACDWLFRVYAEAYTPDWDPHYYTSLYAALMLRCDPAVAKKDSTMALIQALEYFLEGISS